MSLRINHNISSINGQRQLINNQDMLTKSLERLSSGLKINRAADNAAGLVISEQMRAQISGLRQAIDNSETAISMVQTAEGALDEVNNLLTKARELTLHANNSGVNDTNQLLADQAELDNVISSISRISSVTQFGTKKLLDGSLNGAKNLSSNISHVKVGNLANNAAITAGTVTVTMTAGAKESVKYVGGSTADSHIFSSAVTGVNMGTASVNSGVSVTVAIDDQVVSYVTTGAMDATALASQLTAKTTDLGYSVTNNSGELSIERNVIGSSDFTTKITFNRGATAEITGTKEKITSTLQVTSGTAANAATQVFAATALSGVQNTSTVTTGTIFSFQISTASGAVVSGAHTVTTGQTLADVIASVQAIITGTADIGMSGATLALGSGAAGALNFSLARGNDSITTDFNFTMTIDYDSNPTETSEVELLNINSTGIFTGTQATFFTSTGGIVTGGNLTGTSVLGSGVAINLTIDGQTVTVVSGGLAVSGIAASLQTKIQALSGQYSNVLVSYVNSGSTLSGLTSGDNISSGSPAAGFQGFVVYSTDGKKFAVSLAIDQADGTDINLDSTNYQSGATAGATLDLTTTAQARTSGSATTAAVSGRSVSSLATGNVVTNGANAAASLTTANGVVLTLEQKSVSTAGSVTMTLDAAAKALGYSDFSAEFASSLGTSGGIASFTLDNGAEFQVGANALQKVGLTIDNASATELGRGASTKISDLEDLISTKKGALINGLGNEALKVIDSAIDQITNLRGRFGAFQANTLDSGLNSLRVSYENLTAAESTIRDVDFANESANFTRNQILMQASTSMLAQANQLPQNVLKLLG
jgi:flagellin